MKNITLVALLASASIITIPGASAQSAAARQTSFDVPSGDLAGALRKFSRQARIQVIFSAADLRGRRTTGASGMLSARDALARIVNGSGAEIVTDASGAYLVRVASAGGKARPEARDSAEPTPARAPQAAVPQAEQEDGADGTTDIVVTAIRRSLETAQSVKQDSDQIVDSIVAEDVGKLPDVTAAESLARVTGVQVDYAQGGASGTRVRGLPNIATTYNGREIFTAQGRSVALQDFPSSSISRIDVYKSGSADLIEAGIAGEINVRSRKPLDFKGDRIAGGVVGVNWYQSQRLGGEANLLLSKRWRTGIGDIGFLIEGSYTDINFLDSARITSQTILSRNVAGLGTIRYPSFVNTSYPNASRYRKSMSSALQWRPNGELELYADFLYQVLRSTGSARNIQVATGAAANISNIVLIPGTNLVQSMTASAGNATTGQQALIDGNTDTYQGGGGFIWKRDGLRITGDVALTDSTFAQTNLRMNFQTRVPGTRNFNFDDPNGVGGGTVTVSGIDLADPASYRMTALNDIGDINHGRDLQARLDVDYKLGTRGLTNLQAGIRYNTRDFNSDSYALSANTLTATQFYNVLPLEYDNVPSGFRNDKANSIHTFLAPTPESMLANANALRALVGWGPGQPAYARIFDGTEKAYAAYLQGRYAFDLGGMTVDGLVGLRAVHTNDLIHGTQRVTTGSVTTVTPVTRQNSYDDFLPNVSARLKLSRELQLRLAYTQTRTRPGFADLNPSLTIGAPSTVCNTDPTSVDCVRTATGGNADLKPMKSKNYDASLEWYFSRDGSFTVGAFNRDVTGFISDFTTDTTDPQYGRLRVTQPFNGEEGRIRGVEVGFRTFLRASWLPRWLNDFGVLANYTYIDHYSVLPPDLAVTLPGRQPIAGVSNHLANLSAFYENRFFSTRIAYNYRSSFVVSYDRVNDPALGAAVLGPTLPTIEDGRGSLDLNATLNPIENITLTFSVSNLTGEAATNHRQFNAQGQSYPWQARFLESIYRLGVRFRF